MELTTQRRRRLMFATSAVLLFIVVASSIASGDESQMIYPEDFDDVPFEAYDSLGDKERVAICIYWLEAEVNNGGFHQFFFNASGMRAPQTLDALDAIGAQQTEDLLRRAVESAYEGGFPADPTKHQELLREDDEAIDNLNKLDALFFNYEDDLTDLVNLFLKTSKEH